MGGGIGVTLTVSVVEIAFPCASVETHVTVVSPAANVEPLAGAQPTASVPSTTSVALAGHVTTAVGPHGWASTTSGTVIWGGVVSWIVTAKLALAQFPKGSVAVHVTRTLPSANVPGARVHVAANDPPMASVPMTVGHVTVAPPGA